VSRYHARIVVKPEGVWLIDLQSTNGCGVNGRRTSRQILCDGDAVRIGHCMFRFSVLGAEAAKGLPSDAIPLVDASLLIAAPEKDGKGRPQHH
jgi:predicted component of type VI protein secretion system